MTSSSSPLLLIARHGNTFEDGQTPTRVGRRTDLPLVRKGEEQAQKLGKEFLDRKIVPEHIFTSTLVRTIRTAEIIRAACLSAARIEPLSDFDEIDYGPDENRSESDVIARLGKDALERWERESIMPPEWSPRPEDITATWRRFFSRLSPEFSGRTVLVVTSNGIARFALGLCGPSSFSPKLATGGYGVLTVSGDVPSVSAWNIRPS